MRTRHEVPRVTNAPLSHADDIKSRMIKYSVSMGIRMVCIVGAFLVDGWLRWVAITGAIVLPYVAVVLANAGREAHTYQNDTFIAAPPQEQLTATPMTGENDQAATHIPDGDARSASADDAGNGSASGSNDVIAGEVVSDQPDDRGSDDERI
ncbi:DUF3099 domain-containing protein [Saxibacter everestensis]|uniref:DUF3099 domain-containing protein n=1 Tax=Saxibacter everestensis TaxID=2909229 RepID=A0ABY8QZ47_9MICO|nr:DUF3099 domain-containing protein [Brevibacteriaceae bacterium ZFBP1038]